MKAIPSQSIHRLSLRKSALVLALTASALTLRAAPIGVPNRSFESQSGAGQPFGVNIFVDSWEKAAKPDYFDEQAVGFFWIQTAGVFVDTNPYTNHTGTQAAYILPFPGVALFQDYSTLDWNDAAPPHDFNAIYEVGSSYHLTVGVFGKGISDGSLLQLSLYYRDGLNQMVPVGIPNTIVYSPAGFPTAPPLSLIDFSVDTAEVQPGDAWAGQNIGIAIISLYGTGAGNWDFDNVRLAAVPEPSALGLLAFGLAGFLRKRPRFTA